MKKCNISPVASPVRKAEKQKRSYYYQDTNLEDIIENIDSQEQLKKQIASIDSEIESVGKVCDQRKKDSEKAYFQNIAEERKELDLNIMESLSKLEELLNQYKIAKETDYQTIYKSITTKLKKVTKEINDCSKNLIKGQEKVKILEEENIFYSNQLNYAQDMNIYLRYKLSLLSSSYKKKNTEHSLGNSESNIGNNIISNSTNLPNSLKIITSRNKGITNTKTAITKHINQRYGALRDKGLLITSVNSTKNMTNQYSNSITVNKSTTDSNVNIEVVKKQFDYAEKKIKTNMKIIDKELEKKKETYNVVKSAASNVYQTAFRHIINDMRSLPKVSDSHKKINSNSYMSNNSTNNMSESINSAKLNKIDKKEIVIQFLENRQVKNMIYEFLYN